MKKKNHKSLTLLEVTLAIFLAGLLLSTLWEFHMRSSVGHKKIQIAQSLLGKKIFLHQRLQNLFSQVAMPKHPGTLLTPENSYGLYSSLVLSYKESADPDPSFNGLVQSLLYVDSKNRLCLASWPENPTKCRIEVLHDDIVDLQLSFFTLKEKAWQNICYNTEEEGFESLPLWVKMQFTPRKEKAQTFIFRVAHTTDAIVYSEQPIQGS